MMEPVTHFHSISPIAMKSITTTNASVALFLRLRTQPRGGVSVLLQLERRKHCAPLGMGARLERRR